MMDALYPHRELVCTVSSGIHEDLLDYLKENPAEDLSVLVKAASTAREVFDCAPFTADVVIGFRQQTGKAHKVTSMSF